MTLGEIKKSALSLIEEISNNNNNVTSSDIDIENKINFVCNIIQMDLAKIKKIGHLYKTDVEAGDTISVSDIEKEIGRSIYQIKLVTGVKYDSYVDGTILEFKESGTAIFQLYLYPTSINKDTADDFALEISEDAAAIMPLGVAGMVLMSDISENFGKIYTQQYENMKQQLDIRYNRGNVTIEGGADL